MKQSEDDGAGDSQDEHQQALAEKPLTDLLVGALKGVVQADASRKGKEGEKEVVGVFAFEHEVDAEECGGEDVKEMGEPQGNRGEKIACGGSEGFLGARGDGLNVQSVDKGKVVNFLDQGGETAGEVVSELGEIVQDG